MYIGDQIRFNYVAANFPVAKTKRERCLDLGCGNQIYKILAEACGYIYECFDKSPVNNEVKKCDLDNEEEIINLIKQEFYSVILCIDVLEHLKNPLMLLSYLSDLLNTHGRLIIHVPNTNQTHLLIEPKKNEDHKTSGFEPLQIEGILGKFFATGKLRITPTFKWNEAVAWDLNYILSQEFGKEKLLREGIEKLINFKHNFVPYGLLIIGNK